MRVQVVRKPARTKSGFVLVYVPESTGSPHRSKADWKFYVRIASGTIPMEYFQIEDRFGRRPHAQLTVSFTDLQIAGVPMQSGQFERRFSIVVTNKGRGLARFPSLRIKHLDGVVIPNDMFYPRPASPVSYGVKGWVSLRGGSENVVYPDVATLVH